MKKMQKNILTPVIRKVSDVQENVSQQISLFSSDHCGHHSYGINEIHIYYLVYLVGKQVVVGMSGSIQ